MGRSPKRVKVAFDEIALITGPSSYTLFDSDGREFAEVHADMALPPEALGPHPDGTEWHCLLRRFVTEPELDMLYLVKRSFLED